MLKSIDESNSIDSQYNSVIYNILLSVEFYKAARNQLKYGK